jgi:SAM-dependent methyltransferase
MQLQVIDRVARTCPVCQAAGDHPKIRAYSHTDWDTVKCRSCSFVFLKEAPVYEALSEDLAWTKQFEKETKRRKEKQPIVSWLDQKTRWRLHIARDNEWAYITERVTTGNVLDVGCGPINKIPEQFTPFGIEIEKEAARIANAVMTGRGGRVVHAPALEGLGQFGDGFFDGMIMRSYLEHEAQPRAVLELARRKLRPGGVIYVKVPNYGTINRQVRGIDWCGFRFPDHLNYFDLSHMRALAEATGLRMELKNTLTQLTNDNMHVFLTRA